MHQGQLLWLKSSSSCLGGVADVVWIGPLDHEAHCARTGLWLQRASAQRHWKAQRCWCDRLDEGQGDTGHPGQAFTPLRVMQCRPAQLDTPLQSMRHHPHRLPALCLPPPRSEPRQQRQQRKPEAKLPRPRSNSTEGSVRGGEQAVWVV